MDLVSYFWSPISGVPFFLSFWLPLISMQSHERCEFMRRKSTDDNACVLVSECASFYFIFFIEDKKDSLEQIFSHKSSIAEYSLVLFLLRTTNRTRQINAFERCTPPSHTHSQPTSEVELQWFLWRLKSNQCIFSISSCVCCVTYEIDLVSFWT